MHEITLRIYENGSNTFPRFHVRQLVTVTGDEDQMAHAYEAARHIVEGVKWAKPEARIRIDKIELCG